MSQDRRDDKQRPNQALPDPEGDTTMELSIRDVLNIQTRDHKQDQRRPAADNTQSQPARDERLTVREPLRTQSQPARSLNPYDDDDDEDTASTSVVIPDARLLAAAAGKPAHDPTTEVRLDAALLASIRRTEEIHDNETSTFSIPKDLLHLATQGTESAMRTMPMPSVRGPVTIELPEGALEPLTMNDEDERQTRPVGRAPLEVIATIDAQGRLIVPVPALDAAGLRPGQRLKIIAYVIE
jgi:hypothetical protein